MTALIMPSDYGLEMLVGSSPVLGSSFLGGGSSFYPDYSHYAPVWSHSTPASCSTESVSTVSARNYHVTSSPFGIAIPAASSSMAPAPSSVFGAFMRTGSTRKSSHDSIRKRRIGTVVPPQIQSLKSCLTSRTEEPPPDGACSPTREKKKVSFADMNGRNLTQIKIINERPDCPPRWSSDFLEQVTGGAKAEALPDQWRLTFAQPASDYISFKNRLESESVALENIIIRGSESIVSGTIKVRNISYHKKVTLRYTTDNWISTEDSEAIYVPCHASGSSYNIYDTFSFSFPLPSSTSADKVEFCINYEADGYIFWDNNCNKNYTIILFRSKPNNERGNCSKPSDLSDVTMESWSEFSAWNSLSMNESPYW